MTNREENTYLNFLKEIAQEQYLMNFELFLSYIVPIARMGYSTYAETRKEQETIDWEKLKKPELSIWCIIALRTSDMSIHGYKIIKENICKSDL